MLRMNLKLVAVVVTVWLLGGARLSAAADAGAPALRPSEALAKLIAGNERFQSDKTGHPLLHAQRREELVGGQSPFAVILSCSDSRVPPELIFDQGLGGLFVVRLAGNTVTRAGLESIDYAVEHLGTNLIMVLGHDHCGAVKGATAECASRPTSGIPEIFANICPAVELARKRGGANLESNTIDLNVIEQVKILKQSPTFKRRVADGTLRIVGASYNLQSGEVELLDKSD
jgi:carbonic anhydrase